MIFGGGPLRGQHKVSDTQPQGYRDNFFAPNCAALLFRFLQSGNPCFLALGSIDGHLRMYMATVPRQEGQIKRPWGFSL